MVRVVEGKRLYLHLGDRVYSDSHEEWGIGAVVEEMTSTIVGGTCLVRILFEDGHQRTFNNDLDAEMCCYYFGVRKYWNPEEALAGPARKTSRAPQPRRITAARGRARRRQT